MTTQATSIGERWSALATHDEDARRAGMRAILDEVLALQDDARLDAVEHIVRAEYALGAELEAFTASRLRTWLALAADDPDAANTIARGYDAAFERLPADLAMRRATVVQKVARNVMRPEEVEGLFAIIPSLVRQVPRATVAQARPSDVKPKGEKGKPATTATSTDAPTVRPWWKVWAR